MNSKKKVDVALPVEFTEKLERMRYSKATGDNYVIQFQKFLEHIHPKTATEIGEKDIKDYLLYLVKTRRSIPLNFIWSRSSKASARYIMRKGHERK